MLAGVVEMADTRDLGSRAERLAGSSPVARTDFEPETSIRQARLFRRRFPGWGRYGLSAFYARSDEEVLDLAEDRLDQFETLFVYGIAALIDAGFEIVPTYRSPHVTITFYDEPDVVVHQLLVVDHRALANPASRKDAHP